MSAGKGSKRKLTDRKGDSVLVPLQVSKGYAVSHRVKQMEGGEGRRTWRRCTGRTGDDPGLYPSSHSCTRFGAWQRLSGGRRNRQYDVKRCKSVCVCVRVREHASCTCSAASLSSAVAFGFSIAFTNATESLETGRTVSVRPCREGRKQWRQCIEGATGGSATCGAPIAKNDALRAFSSDHR